MISLAAHRPRAALVLALALSLPMLACGLGTTNVTSTPVATTPASAPHGIAWIQMSGSAANIWASLDDSAPIQVTNAPPPGTACLNPSVWGYPMLSPDLTHVVVAAAGCTVDSQISGDLYVVTVATGVAKKVPLPAPGVVQTNVRSYGWVDSSTIFAVGPFSSGPGGVVYMIGSSSVTPLPGIPTTATEAVARGSTLFYLEADSAANVASHLQLHAYVHRYDLGAHSSMPGAVDLGAFLLPLGSPGDYHEQGWDASPDGRHLVYQATTPAVPVSGPTFEAGGIASQTIYYANADGSGASPIVQYMVTSSLVRMRISPNGKQVGITEAYGTPDVLSGCVDSPGKKNDPCLQFYSPDASGYPAWKADTSAMIAAATNSGGARDLWLYTAPHFAATTFVSSAYNPWSTP